MCDVVWQAFGRLQRAWRGVVDLMQVHRALFWQTPLHFTSPFQREREGGGVYESQESIRGLVYCLRTHTHTHTHTHTNIELLSFQPGVYSGIYIRVIVIKLA